MAELLAVGDLDFWNKVSTGVFLALFVALFLWTYRPGGKEIYVKRGNMPLEEEKANYGK